MAERRGTGGRGGLGVLFTEVPEDQTPKLSLVRSKSPSPFQATVREAPVGKWLGVTIPPEGVPIEMDGTSHMFKWQDVTRELRRAAAQSKLRINVRPRKLEDGAVYVRFAVTGPVEAKTPAAS